MPFLMSLLVSISIYMIYAGIAKKRQSQAAASAAAQRLQAFQAQSRLGSDLLEQEERENHEKNSLFQLGNKLSDIFFQGSGGIGILERIDEKLILSGRPHGWYAQDWIAFAFLVLVGSVAGGGLMVQAGLPKIIYLFLVGFACYYAWWELVYRIKKRQEQVSFELPYLLDELIMNISSGAGSLDLVLRDLVAGDTAFAGATSNERILVTELRRAYQEATNQARNFADAYRAAANRIQVQAVDDLVEVLIEGQAGGAPILSILRDMSRQIYIQYEQDVATLIKKKDSTFTIATVIMMLGSFIVIGAPIVQSVMGALGGK